MNKYHIQIDNPSTNHWDWITIYAETELDAVLEASRKISDTKKYSGYYVSSVSSPNPETSCINSNVNDIILPYNSQEDVDMAFFNVNWGNYTDDLSKLAMDEPWSNSTYPDKGILKNYLTHTYNKVKSDKNIIQTSEYALFNTGLFTKYYEPIYAYATDHHSATFLTEYDLGNLGIERYPERANYFIHPELLLFDWHYKINVQYKHILEDEENKTRIPSDILESGNIVTLLDGAINTMKKRVSCNYKLAIPQYFSGQIQLLLPLCLRSDNIPDLALVVTKTGKYYQGHTCLTLDMAYNNARLIAKPESNWLSQ